jgi:hypothetical protein
MSHLRQVVLVSLILGAVQSISAQQVANPQAVLSGVVALLGATTVQSTTLSGNAEFIAGATDDTGSFTATCSLAGSSQLQLQLGSSSRTESRQTVNGVTGGAWTDNLGQQHSMATQNLFTTASWFCPHLALSSFLQNTGISIQFVGDETRNGVPVVHFTVSTPPVDSSAQSLFLSRLSTTEIYLDAVSQRPVAIAFNAHSDSDAKIDIPIEIRFSNYTNSNGVWIPYTIQRYVNSNLSLTMQVNSASPSSALQ